MMKVQLENSWAHLLSEEFEKPYFKSLIHFVESEYERFPHSIFPKEDEIFRAFDLCPVENVRIVILGQDPYPTKGHAHGLCFSCDSDIRPLPKSLKNIFNEIENDLGIKMDLDGDLKKWAQQGVLLLNSVLTVREGLPESHANKGWETYTDAVLFKLSREQKNVVYFLWGSKAQQKMNSIEKTDNLILSAPHPSPLSSYRGFFGCKHFSKANDYLKSKDKTIINW